MGKKYRVSVSGKSYEVDVEEVSTGTEQAQPNMIPVAIPQPSVTQTSSKESPSAPTAQPAVSSGQSDLTAPIPGNIFKIHASAGDTVKSGDLLLVIEAMKMENEISAEADGIISDIPVKEGDNVAAGDVLVRFQ